MKKFIIRGAACALAAASLLSLCACGFGEKQDQGNTSAPVSSAVSAPAESNAAEDGLYASVEELLNTDEMQEEIQALKDSLAEEDMDVEIKAEGNTMVLAFDLTNVPDLDEDTAAAAAELLASSMESVFEEMAEELSNGIVAEGAAVEARFLMNGQEIYSQEYSA